MSGDQVCLSELGSGPHFGTFPRHMLAESLMDSPNWIRVLRPPTKDEKITRGIHYEPLDPGWRAKTIILNRKGAGEPFVCVRHDCIGGTASMPTESITVLLSKYTFQVEERECADLSNVEAPKTPPMGYFRCSPPRAVSVHRNTPRTSAMVVPRSSRLR